MKKLYLSILTSYLTFTSVFSQNEFVNSGGSVTVQSGALLWVKGEVKGQGAATMDIAGDLFINTENTSVDPAYPTGLGEIEWNSTNAISNTSGKITFSGSGDAKIHGSSNLTLTTGTLNINVVRLVGASPVLNEAFAIVDRNVTVTNLQLLSGLVKVSNGLELFVDNTSANAITDSSLSGYKWGDRESAFVVGRLKRSVVASNTYTYPVGSELRGYNRYDLILAGTPSGNNAVSLEFEDFLSTPSFVTPVFTTAYGCSGPSFVPFQGAEPQYVEIDQMVPNFGKWKVRATNQSSTSWSYGVNAYPNIKAVNVSPSTSLSDFAPFDHLHLIKGNDGALVTDDWSQWVNVSGLLCTFANFDGTNIRGSIYSGSPIEYYIPARGLTGFSDFGVGGGGTSSGLPVELISLRADPINNKFIRVSWATATEINNAGFEVYKSEDGVNFSYIGWVNGNGNSSTQNNYHQDDHDVVANKVYYYRLRQVDFDGQSETTHIVSAMITAEGVFVISEFIPNPADNATSLIITSSDDRDVTVEFYTTLGQLISSNTLIIQKGENRFDFNLSDFAAGTYHSLITADEHTFNKKIVVTR